MESTDEAMNAKMDSIANAAEQAFPDACIVALIIDEEGNAHYVSNLERSDAIDVLKQFVLELGGEEVEVVIKGRLQ